MQSKAPKEELKVKSKCKNQYKHTKNTIIIVKTKLNKKLKSECIVSEIACREFCFFLQSPRTGVELGHVDFE